MKEKIQKLIAKIALIFLSAVLFFLFIAIVHGIPAKFFTTFKKPTQISISNADSIESWMTFRYLNKVFNLPNDYLKNKFNIKDSHYPDISLAKYAKKNQIDKSSFTEEIKKAVKEFSENGK